LLEISIAPGCAEAAATRFAIPPPSSAAPTSPPPFQPAKPISGLSLMLRVLWSALRRMVGAA